ncbi:glycosyltransferase family 2 protein [Corynebacterium choanae]|uniref:Glycosyl transferase family 2 n=1 Tax=Corynebacterium choanae TaxID=1862358 RepID=A0A3G6J646_9CORY|nr:glycosyltransferase family 2 protein [Corynebacterium choanae]AZA13243.1 hypothetical protein CCHOA_04170 [Corynebacterium choanae]
MKAVEHVIVTMSRGDEGRLEDWLDYHSNLGFDRFIIILDNPIDDSEQVLHELQQRGLNIEIIIKEPFGEYFDNIAPTQFNAVRAKWVKENQELIASMDREYPIVDPLSWRQYLYFPPLLKQLSESGKDGWVSVLDVDEYIVLPQGTKIDQLTDSTKLDRLSFLNFNVDMSGWDGVECVRRFANRWAFEDVKAYGKGWDRRVKSLVRFSASYPMVSVHGISRSNGEVLDWQNFYLMHYKYPTMDALPYSVLDLSLAKDLSKVYVKPDSLGGRKEVLKSRANQAVHLDFRDIDAYLDQCETKRVIHIPRSGNYRSAVANCGLNTYLEGRGIEVVAIFQKKLAGLAELPAEYLGELVVLHVARVNDAAPLLDHYGNLFATAQSKLVVVTDEELSEKSAESLLESFPIVDHIFIQQAELANHPKISSMAPAASAIRADMESGTRLWRIATFANMPEDIVQYRNNPRLWELERLGDGTYQSVEPLQNIIRSFDIVYCDNLEMVFVCKSVGTKAMFVCPPGNSGTEILKQLHGADDSCKILLSYNEALRDLGIIE